MRRAQLTFARRLTLVAVLGAALRLLYLLTWGRHPNTAGDWTFYHVQANLLAEGRGFIEPFQYLFRGEHVPSAAHPPLYSLALAGVSELGGTTEMAHRALGVVLGAGTIALVGLVGRHAVGGGAPGERAGLLAAVLCAVYPTMVAADAALLSETLFALLIAGTLLAAYRFAQAPSRGRAALLGLGVGLAALTRAEALLLLVLLVVPLVWRAPPGRVLTGAVAVGACLLVIAPWTIRNADVFGRFVPISNNDSTVIAGANCPSTYAGPNLGFWEFTCLSPAQTSDEAAQGVIWRREGIEYARDHADRLPVVLPVRLLRVWDLYQPRRMSRSAEGREPRTEQVSVLVFYLYALLAVGGVLVLRRSGRPTWILLAPFVAVTVAALLGYGLPRLRISAEPGLCVLAAVGALELLRRWRARREAGAAPA